MNARQTSLRLQDLVANAARAAINLRREQAPPADYVRLEVKGNLPEREASRSLLERRLPFVDRDLSIEGLNLRLDVIANDPAVEGVVLHLGELEAPLARIQNARAALQRFKRRGKRVVAYSPLLDLQRYYLATAADELLIPESTAFHVTGIATQVAFLKDTLARVGISGDFEATGAYKTAVDPIQRSAISDAHREMLNAIADSFYADLQDAIAGGRQLDRSTVDAFINDAPWMSTQAVEAGFADGLIYEDEVPGYLGDGDERRSIAPWEQAQTSLRRPYRWRGARSVGVIALEGTIVSGESRDVPLPVPIVGTQAGAVTLARAFRRAERNPAIAAVVFYVNSGGGDAIASDLIWREVKRVSEKKPVVAYLGDVAASGGYYVVAPASRIVAQSASLTGSIGVISGKLVLGSLYDRLDANWEVIKRGDHAVMYLSDDPFTPEERETVRRHVAAFYTLFKQRVADGRKIAPDDVEKIAQGRVWTGRQAKEIGLVNELGDFRVAVDRAKLLAGLPLDDSVPVVRIEPPKRYTPPPAFSQPDDWLRHVAAGLRSFTHARALALMPWTLDVKG
jgi:protease-4